VAYAENSVAAVAAAAQIGADGVEIDVWLTSDKHLIVNHDRVVARRPIPSTPRATITALSPLASLEDVLVAAADLRVNVEIKATRSSSYNMAVARAVSDFLDSSPASSRCLVSSFSLAICDEVRRLSPERRVGWLVGRRPHRSVLDEVAKSGLTSAHLAFSRVNAAVVDRAENLGVELHVWTPNLRRDLDHMIDLGVGALITDDVVLALELREDRRRTGARGDDRVLGARGTHDRDYRARELRRRALRSFETVNGSKAFVSMGDGALESPGAAHTELNYLG
jgi:glycerophosphoryl diester phosphodiesterase